MSQGNPVVTFRIPADLVDKIDEYIARRNLFTKEEEWVRSDFIRAAIREKVAHMDRSRRGTRAKKPPSAKG